MKTILVVDDEVEIVKLIQMRLEANNYKVVTAYNGAEAYAQYLSEKPDLIILDIMLPKLTGCEVCRKIKREHRDTKTVILMLTAKGKDEERIIGRVIGADLYMLKPFDPKELLSNISLLLGL